jgi:hypothetical protein
MAEKNNKLNQENKYFATYQGEDLLEELVKRVKHYDDFVRETGLEAVWEKSYSRYFGKNKDGFKSSSIGRAGARKELSVLVTNDYRSILTNIHVLTTDQRPTFKTRAVNTDQKSIVQTIFGDRLLEYYMREKNVEEYTDDCAELSLYLGEGWVTTFWNAQSGEIYGTTENGAPIYEGDIEFDTYGPMEVARDVDSKSARKLDWIILKQKCNKYTLAGKFPEKAEKIIDCKMEDNYLNKSFSNRSNSDDVSDQIIKYIFIHKKTEALPQGRYVEFLNNELKLIDNPLPYRNLSAYRMAPGEIHGTSFGYTIAFDMLGIEDVKDALLSTIATNQLNFGVQNISVEEGGNINFKSLTSGLNLLTHKRGAKPEPLNLTYTPPEIFNFVASLEAKEEKISGVNSVVRGSAPANVRSGNAMALLAAQTTKFSSGYQKSYSRLLEHVGTSIITLLIDFAKVPRVASIIGEFNQSYMKEFSGDDISLINRVSVELVNPVARTADGRMQMAQHLLQSGAITSVDQYMMVIETGKTDPMTESNTRENLLVRAENEKMTKGEIPPAIFTDNHDFHLREHKNVLSDPSMRQEPDVINAVTVHCQDHIRLKQTTDPNLLAIFGQQPAQPSPQGGGMGQMQAPQAGMQETDMQNAQQPSMPVNPESGEQFDINA